jgi:4-hydroxybenzoate polyprenyltransferase
MDTEREAIRLAGKHTYGDHYQKVTMTVAELAQAEQPRRAVRSGGRRRAAGIYGTIITAAVIAATGVRLTTLALVVSVLVTLLVYWVAEEYAELLGEQLEAGRLPTWLEIRTALAATWPMVSASYVPLLALVLARWLGASPSAAANVGLVVAVMLMILYGWSAGRAARVDGKRLFVITSVAAALGLMMIVLKDVVLIHLH